ncbi:hypothetical protein RQM59_03470 [Flavobacteriaceae bacterium S356]|uniref:Uncharacterized protein n=1 Tax=Asprobacillus argus TaxID=3076534 RepID=A0ABU3LCU5_9FLAO|nr:hypothetical protein [Flavobacteriaceae bacterium S356]
MKTFLLKNRKRVLIGFIFAYILLFVVVNKQNELFRYAYGEKMWVHRVNSTEKLAEVSTLFKGFELDVIFVDNTGVFDVNHPPAKSISLTLSTYLSSVDDASVHYFWLDFKNLTPANKQMSYLRLDSIRSALSLQKELFIIESRTPENLDVFHLNGYRTSYYLPSGLYQLNAEDLNKETARIKRQVAANKTTYISANLDHYGIMKRSFPEQNVLTWPYKYKQEWHYNPITLFKNLKKVYYKYKVLSNDKINVVLFTYDSEKGNR